MSDVTSYIGRGVVVNPSVLLDVKWKAIDAAGYEVNPARLKISSRAHMVTPAHIALDAAQEQARGEQAIGTTLRGIGPAFVDRTSRKGLTIGLLSSPLQNRRGSEKPSAREKRRTSTQVRCAPELDSSGNRCRFYILFPAAIAPYLVDDSQFMADRTCQKAHDPCRGNAGHDARP